MSDKDRHELGDPCPVCGRHHFPWCERKLAGFVPRTSYPGLEAIEARSGRASWRGGEGHE